MTTLDTKPTARHKPKIEMVLHTCRRCGSLVEKPSPKSIRALREWAGLGLRELASKLNLSPSYLSDVESGRRNVTPVLEMIYMSLKPR